MRIAQRILRICKAPGPLNTALIAYSLLGLLLAAVWSDGDMLPSVKFLLYQLLVLYIPGRAIACALRYRAKTDMDLLAISYGLGFAWSTALYFVVRLLGNLSLFWPIEAAVAAVSLSMIARRPLKVKRLSVNGVAAFSLLLTIMAIALFFCYSEANYAPDMSANSFYRDNGYFLGNAVELKLEFPPRDFRSIFYDAYSYHYLPSAQLALMSWAVGLPVFDLVFGISYLQNALLLCASAFSLFHALTNSYGMTSALMAILLFGTGLETYTTVNYLSHIYIASFGFDIALAFSLLFCLISCDLFTCGKTCDCGSVSIGLAFFAILFGSKGPLGILALVSSFIFCAHALFIRRDLKLAFIFGLGVLLLAATLYVFLMRDTAERTIINDTSERSITTVKNLEGIYLAIKGMPLPSWLGEIIYTGFYALCCNPAVVLLFALGTGLVILKRQICVEEIAFLCAATAGIVLLRLIVHSGFSQMYFLLGAYPYALALFACAVRQDARKVEQRGLFRQAGKRHPSAPYCLVSFMVGLSLAFSCSANHEGWLEANASKGLQHLLGMNTADDLSEASGYKSNRIDPALYSALIWLRETSSASTTCASDDILVSSSTEYPYYPAAIAERWFYMPFEGNDREMYETLRRLFSGEATERDWTLLSQRRITHVLQHNTEIELDVLYGQRVRTVFSAHDVRVYEISK